MVRADRAPRGIVLDDEPVSRGKRLRVRIPSGDDGA